LQQQVVFDPSANFSKRRDCREVGVLFEHDHELGIAANCPRVFFTKKRSFVTR
jgi:hypothetical protein